jgi:hypothetical protein
MGNQTATALQRAEELLAEMTLEEKAMQLSCVVPLALLGPDRPMRGQLDSLLASGIGHVAGVGLLGHKLPGEIARSVNAIQRYHGDAPEDPGHLPQRGAERSRRCRVHRLRDTDRAGSDLGPGARDG